MTIYVEKKYQRSTLPAVVEDSLESGSHENAPSVNAVRKAIGNPNLLINSNFINPVNQRGLTTYEGGAWKYTIDRWRTNNCELVVNDNSITITNTSDTDGHFQQVFEENLSKDIYSGSCKVVAVSGNVRMFYGAHSEMLEVGENDFVFNEYSGNFFALVLTTGASVTLEWLKFEQSKVATSFAPRLYAEELALCQRYYEKFTEFTFIGTMQWGNIIYFTIPTVEKRITPTGNFVLNGGDFAILLGSDSISLTKEHLYFDKFVSNKIMVCYVNTVTPTSIGINHIPGYTCNVNANGGAYVEFDAEIY